MTTENTARQPKGVPVGGQFAATAHAEPAVSLAPPAPQDVLRSSLTAAAEKNEALLQSEWAQDVWAKYPHASFADVHIAGSGKEGLSTAGVDLYDAEGIQIDLDFDDEANLEESFDVRWGLGTHRDDARVVANLGPYSTAFSLDSIKERWDEMASSPEPLTDPFAHLTGMDRARAQSEFAQQLNREATAAYVEDLSAKLLAINPEFSRLYVNRNADVETGLTFTLDHVEDIHGNHGDVDLMELQDHGFQDIHLDPHVDYQEAGDRLYINLDPGN
ncbi:hypothetical protein Achl_4004 (plasmid) [Pseudarthrobacter chlorophenolicus A6]|uniref:Uncharacterized protein n=1 Tax=Pseudarthrobacter chlorophenolicus (strain ATCC 700700 / DSM 12829 / CIP 107037 / JCM 12360 / KCTC 9906 / NCIMB 13794 / A6) TaxID=452863 RepID=B8HHQ8_PSECP|nr:hypothetical protein [Pseudarthrobacter chlorophenolicus]ACL41955.1 hypothetical protein Achl_4004 [Pseudarthrobacter chlorophenolicus A6]SDQ19412.1 hypothetical protein SAMN04489738_0655 [Pseudarthrobacter chlorophenolicus]